MKKQSIQYPVEYKHLRNYFKDGGVFYFVVVISNDGEKFSVFYNVLTPIKLQSLLSDKAAKRPDQTKNITLLRLKKNDNKELYRLLCQFAHDSKEQGIGELVRNSIDFEDMGRLNAIRTISFTKDWWWDGKVIPILLLQQENSAIGRVCNILATKEMEIKIERDGIHYRVPRFVHLKNDIWEKLYDIEEDILMDDLEACDFNKETESLLAMSFLEILTAYDTVGYEKYYNLAVCMADKLLSISPECDDWRLNQLQLVKRKRELTEEELRKLEEMECHGENRLILCAVNVLLDNKRKAVNIFRRMELGEQEVFQSYPIYQIYKR